MNDFKKKIHERALVIARDFKRVESEVIGILQEVEESRLFLDFGMDSLYQYATTKMGLSEDVASNFILAARKSKLIPILRQAIQDGSISVNKVRKAASVLTPENQEKWPEWVNKMKTLSSKSLEREVAKENPKAAVSERTQYVSGDRLELRIGISQAMFEKIKKVQDLQSKRLGKSVSIEEAFEASVDVYLEAKDPVKRAERILKRKVDQNKTAARRADQLNQSTKPIPARQKHEVNYRDGGQCTQVYDGKRCENRRYTDTHHIVARSLGGDHSIENLTTLCSAHHKMIHRPHA
jgi:hypothetical protein